MINNSNRSHILLVDFDSQSCSDKINFLNKHGCQATGKTSLQISEISNGSPFEIFILNFHPLEFDAFYFAKNIRRMNQHAGILIIMPKETQNGRMRAYSAGADDHLFKPFENIELHACIKSIQRKLKY